MQNFASRQVQPWRSWSMQVVRILHAWVLSPIEMLSCGIVFWPCDVSGCGSIIAATTEAPSRHIHRRGSYSVAEGGTQRADSTAPIVQQCQSFLSNLVALLIRVRVVERSESSNLARSPVQQVFYRSDCCQ